MPGAFAGQAIQLLPPLVTGAWDLPTHCCDARVDGQQAFKRSESPWRHLSSAAVLCYFVRGATYVMIDAGGTGT